MIVYTKVPKYKPRNKSKERYEKLDKKKLTGVGNRSGSYSANWRRPPNIPSYSARWTSSDTVSRSIFSISNEKMEKEG